MKNNSMKDFLNFLKYLPVFKKIGLSVMTMSEIKKVISELMPEMDWKDKNDKFSILDPFIKENLNHTYEIDIEVLRNTLADFFSEFIPGLLSEDVIRDYTISHFENKIFVSIEEVENEDNQSYRYLYQMLFQKHEELQEAFYGQKYELDNAHRDLAEQHVKIKCLRENNGNMKNITTDITAFIKDFITKDIIVQKVEARNMSGEILTCGSDSRKSRPMPELSNAPGIYSFKRPSWFTPLCEEMELNKKNTSKKNLKHTEDTLLDKVLFWKLFKKDKSTIEVKAQYVDNTRKRNLEKLLTSDLSNEEKYLKYILLTPGIDKEYMKTLNGAAELGLNASVVIELLEQPAESFNREMIEAYVSQVHKATEYNLKLELAEELIRGEWYITSEINGSKQKYQLVPLECILEIEKRLQHICDVFEEYEKISASFPASHTEDIYVERKGDEEFGNNGINSGNSQNEYSDTDLFDEPSVFMEDEVRDQEEMEILFVQQVESEFIKSEEL